LSASRSGLTSAAAATLSLSTAHPTGPFGGAMAPRTCRPRPHGRHRRHMEALSCWQQQTMSNVLMCPKSCRARCLIWSRLCGRLLYAPALPWVVEGGAGDGTWTGARSSKHATKPYVWVQSAHAFVDGRFGKAAGEYFASSRAGSHSSPRRQGRPSSGIVQRRPPCVFRIQCVCSDIGLFHGRKTASR
jgi:hypothetical protein